MIGRMLAGLPNRAGAGEDGQGVSNSRNVRSVMDRDIQHQLTGLRFPTFDLNVRAR